MGYKTGLWIRSDHFISDHSQGAVVDGEQSYPAPVTCGVPKGSAFQNYFSYVH